MLLRTGDHDYEILTWRDDRTLLLHERLRGAYCKIVQLQVPYVRKKNSFITPTEAQVQVFFTLCPVPFSYA